MLKSRITAKGRRTEVFEEESPTAVEEDTIEQVTIKEDPNETSLRKSSFLSAAQSDRITVLAGPSQLSFQVPQDLLIRWSPPLGEMCRSGLEESRTRVIRLPHVKESTFEDFFIWMHACEPRVDLESFAPVLDLAIFAEMYIFCQLKNQTSDIIRTELGSGRWQVTPDIVSMVYDEVPSGSILRQLCSVSLALPVLDPPTSRSYGFGGSDTPMNAHRKHDNYLKWEPVFEKHSDLGWDYFRQLQAGNSKTAVINWGGPCRFHDHRDIPDAGRQVAAKCPYPRGALPKEQSIRSLPNAYQHGVSMDAQPVLEELPTVDEEAPRTQEL